MVKARQTPQSASFPQNSWFWFPIMLKRRWPLWSA